MDGPLVSTMKKGDQLPVGGEPSKETTLTSSTQWEGL